MKYYIKIIVIAVLSVMCYGMASAHEGDKILGTYNVLSYDTKEPSKVKFYKEGDTYQAQIIWLKQPLDEKGNPRLDVKNPNPALRSVRGDEVVIITGLRYNEKSKKWSGGKIYNPVVGKSFDVAAEMTSPTSVSLRCYMGSPMFGKTFVWSKIK